MGVSLKQVAKYMAKRGKTKWFKKKRYNGGTQRHKYNG